VDITFAQTASLVAEAQAGTEAARNELFERYRPRVVQMVSLRLGRSLRDLADVEDLVQETLLDALRGLERFEHRSVGAFRSWLATLAVNRIRAAARLRSTRKRGDGAERRFSDVESRVLTESLVPGREAAPEDHAARAELAGRIERALLDLEERDRRVIELRRIGELSFDEIASELGLGSPGAARAQFARSLRRLGERLGEERPGG